MSWTREAALRGGETTLARYGRAHFAAITKGRPRLPRYSKNRNATPSSVAHAPSSEGKGVPHAQDLARYRFA